MMNIKRRLATAAPYIIGGLVIFAVAKQAFAQNNDQFLAYGANVSNADKLNSIIVAGAREKADKFTSAFAENVVKSIINLQTGKKSCRAELPGAPPGMFCQYGLYMQHDRTSKALGDTINKFPAPVYENGDMIKNPRTACLAFIDVMTEQYSDPEYSGAVRRGKLYSSGDAYYDDMNKYIRDNLKSELDSSEVADFKAAALRDQFMKNNILADDLNPGDYLYFVRGAYRPQTKQIPKNATPARHASIYLGKGLYDYKNGFVADKDASHKYGAFNNNRVSDVFNSYYRTDDVIVVDMNLIATKSYEKEAMRFLGMMINSASSDIAGYLGIIDESAYCIEREKLIEKALMKYLGISEDSCLIDRDALAEVRFSDCLDIPALTLRINTPTCAQTFGPTEKDSSTSFLIMRRYREFVLRTAQRSPRGEKRRV
jgi:hypothetical protein